MFSDCPKTRSFFLTQMFPDLASMVQFRALTPAICECLVQWL